MRILFLLMILVGSLSAQDRPSLSNFDPDDILVAGEERAQVMLLGTFHFNYPNLDAHVTDEANQVNVEEGNRAQELQEVLDYVARFQPTKIVVERWPESNTDDYYQSYLAGDFELRRSEIYQIGFRLAKRFGHEHIYPCDAGSVASALEYLPDSAVIHPIMDSIYKDWDFSGDSKFDTLYDKLYDLEDEMLADASLLEYFKYENSPHRIRRGHGAYLIGDFELDVHRGADALAMYWYSRNLRIFRNIQRISKPDDRVLVIFGAGHLGILHQQFESSPEFELIEFESLETYPELDTQSEPEVDKTKVYLLGSFHFAQVDSSYDIFSEANQSSISDLCDLITAQHPDKIFVERQPEFEFQNRIDSLYSMYKDREGEALRAPNEIYQLGFRSAKRLGHSRVYQCDHPGIFGALYRETLDYAEKNNQMDVMNAERVGTVTRQDDLVNEDSLMHQTSLLNYIRWINSDEVMRTSHASYIANYTQVGSTDFYNYDDDYTLIGAELTADWYRRNIMMYTKMINQLDYTEDAILLVVGSDHVPIISSLFEANPYFEVVHPEEWLGDFKE
ncbi:MAG: DUF5694 domain-containing protein [Bacteroidota bacterium]